MRILTINGIRTNGEDSTDRFGDYLANDFDVIDINYPKVSIFSARYKKLQIANAKKILDKVQDGDVLIAHSYGCMLALRAMEAGAKFSKVFLFAPAMNIDFTFPYLGMQGMKVIHNKTDKAIKMGNWLWFHDFGKMGRVGYQGAPDPRIENIEDFGGIKGGRNHSHYFDCDNIDRWVEYIKGELDEKTT